MRPHGPIFQFAYIVSDMEAALDHWTRRMHVGPFFLVRSPPVTKAEYRGEAFTPLFDAAIAYSGDAMIELIKPDGPSIFREFLESGGTGVQHYAAFTQDIDQSIKALSYSGGACVQRADHPDGSRVAYVDMGGAAYSSVIELCEFQPPVIEMFAALKSAGAKWDGTTRLTRL